MTVLRDSDGIVHLICESVTKVLDVDETNRYSCVGYYGSDTNFAIDHSAKWKSSHGENGQISSRQFVATASDWKNTSITYIQRGGSR